MKTESMKVPLQVGWLSENNLLVDALKLLGYSIDANATCIDGIVIHTDKVSVPPYLLKWDEHLQFTVAQLLKFGFEPGEFEYCPFCKRLQVDCDKEKADIDAYNMEGEDA